MEDFKNLKETMIKSEEIFDGEVVYLFKDTVELPNGKTATREAIRHIGAVAIVPLTDDGKVIIERQFRYPLNRFRRESWKVRRRIALRLPEGSWRRRPDILRICGRSWERTVRRLPTVTK